MKTEFEKVFLSQRNEEQAKHLSKFFKTGKGQYGEGDVFLGLAVPKIRAIVKEFYQKYSVNEISNILKSPYHEIRLGALLMLVKKYEKSDEAERKSIYEAYVQNIDYVNNWDLVDLTAPNIVGHFILNYGSTDNLWRLAKSGHLWAERVSIVASLHFIRNNKFDYTLEVSEHFLTHKHDLIHKATGWMLREVGKRDVMVLYEFLDKHAQKMPRTALRYAIEKFDKQTRKKYMACKLIKS